MILRTVADDAGVGTALEINRNPQAILDHRRMRAIGLKIDQRFALIELAEFDIRGRRVATHETNLIQARALLQKNAEGAWHDFQIELAAIALAHTLEFVAVIGDQARKDIETAGGAFRIGLAGNTRRQFQLFHQLDNVDAAFFQHGWAG